MTAVDEYLMPYIYLHVIYIFHKYIFIIHFESALQILNVTSLSNVYFENIFSH